MCLRITALLVVVVGVTIYILQSDSDCDTVISLQRYAKLMISKVHVHVDDIPFLQALTHHFTADNVFTKEQLSNKKYQWLSIVGEVYDVTYGEKHYGKDGHYKFFTGLDGTRAFSTGDFTEKGLIEDIEGLTPNDVKGIEGFRAMYAKEYIYLGKLVGHYYDNQGHETSNKEKYRALLAEADKLKAQEEEMFRIFPGCNSEFNNQVSRVWCSSRSGGIDRAWVGVPRKLYQPGMVSSRCACVRTEGPPSFKGVGNDNSNRGDLDHPNLREYDNCSPSSATCYT